MEKSKKPTKTYYILRDKDKMESNHQETRKTTYCNGSWVCSASLCVFCVFFKVSYGFLGCPYFAVLLLCYFAGVYLLVVNPKAWAIKASRGSKGMLFGSP